jgi:hypothetical protein
MTVAPLSLVVASLVGARPLEVQAPPAAPGDPPGGYWRPGELRRPEPDDGHASLVLGSILFPLGILRAGAGVLTAVLASPAHCQQLFPGVSPDDCRGLYVYGLVGTALGGALAAAGAVFLARGLIRREGHRRWKLSGGLALAPVPLGRGAGSAITLRF